MSDDDLADQSASPTLIITQIHIFHVSQESSRKMVIKDFFLCAGSTVSHHSHGVDINSLKTDLSPRSD